jgi:hypothetical protein
MPALYVLKVPEFLPVVEAARASGTCSVRDVHQAYFLVESKEPIMLNRKALKMPPAVWYGLLTGGFSGRIGEFGRDILVVQP